MSALSWWPTRILLALLVIAAIALGVTGSAFDMEIALWEALLLNVAACCLFTLLLLLSSKVGREMMRFFPALMGELIGGTVLAFPSVVLLSAPVFFMLTGAVWTWTIAGSIAFLVSLAYDRYGGFA